ncbi:hypothetical protein AMAG_14662 [Allomyces macrogynus ATCC 38327]|uniref:Uncharacterized protein n=1 Tax=Allomyces macrogynus (strain ATCC 38327) TaxID=578462 RepID=A0A0L0T735_ALLM3|nr:hypothetical protein AMAG_14662 [Allomyces macrogynus ATCC 38327]|eukprot:KNE70540.1 hypothetical protein AMAG_14662 [Allomyces macrogynus ATCC 38327]
MAQSKKSAHASKSASSSAPISATPVSKATSRSSSAANSLTTLNETVPHAAAVDPPLVPINTNATVEDLYRQIHALQLTLSMTRKASRHLLSVGQSLEADKLAADRALVAKAHECDLLAAEVVDLRKQVADVRATLGTMRRALESARDELARRRTVEAEFATLREKFHAEMVAMESGPRSAKRLARGRVRAAAVAARRPRLSDLYPNPPTAHPADPCAAAARSGPSSSVNGHHPASASVTGDDHDDEDDDDVEDDGELGDEDLDEDEDAGDEDGGDEYDDEEEDDEEEAMLDEEEVDEDEDDEEEEEKSYNDLARDFLRCLELKDYAGFCSNVAHLVTHEQAQHVNDWNALAIGALWLIAMAGDCHSLHPVSRGLTPTLTETHVQNVIESLPDVRDRHEWVLTIAQLHESAVHNSPREFYAMLDSLAASNMVKQVSPLRDILNALRILQRIRFLNWFIVSDNRYKRSNQVSLRMAVFKTDFRDVTQLRQWLERELDGTDTPLNLGAGGKTLLEARTVKQKLHDKLKGAENTYKKALEYLTTAIPPAVPGTIIRKH